MPPGLLPSTETRPSVGSKIPAITDRSVVFPQPLGPTNKVICPVYTSRSTLRSAITCVPPEPNSFVTPSQCTATCAAAAAARIFFALSQWVFHFRHHPLNTIAGSTTNTLRMLNRLDNKTITITATAVMASTHQGMKNASLD